MNVETLKKEIASMDEALLQLLLKRLELEETVPVEMREPVARMTDRRETLRNMAAIAGEREQEAWLLFSTLFSLEDARTDASVESGRLTETVKAALEQGKSEFPRSALVACQGTEGANSQAAAEKLFPRGHLMYFKTFEAVFDAVNSGLCQYGVLPIENSSNGSVRAVYDLLQRKNFSVVRSTCLRIRHELMTKPGTKLSDIRVIYSHEQALGQCSRYLNTLSGVKLIPCANTAVAARMVAEAKEEGAAAIASVGCAELYGLEILKTDIQNNDNNYTRFLCIAAKPVIYSGANKISIVLACANQPGALHDVLAKIRAAGLNMSKIESCPVSGSSFEFIFFLDLEGAVTEPGVLPMLESLSRSAQSFQLLGCYQEV